MTEHSDTYLLVVNGKPQGPYTIDQLRSLGIKPGDFVRSAGMDDYKEAHEIAHLRQLFHFATPPVLPQYYAGFDQRLLACALDWFITGGILLIIAVIAVVFSQKQAQLVTGLCILALTPIANLIYHIVMECSPKQGTYGKQLVKIKVCDLHGERISTGKAIGRNLAKIFSALVLFAGYLLCFFTRKQQCLHDMLADALVVKDRLV